MTRDSAPEGPRPPVAFGLFLVVAAGVAVLAMGACAVAFLESGAETGEIRLDRAEAYAPGEVVFLGDRNVFLVRLPGGDFVALRDLDAANQQAGATACRVSLAGIDDPSLPLDPSILRARFSAEAAGARAVFRENCQGAAYDVAGALVTGEGRNLDRYSVAIDSSGWVVLDLSQRTCSVRTERDAFVRAGC